MKLSINENGDYTLYASSLDKVACHACGKADINNMFFCEQDKKLYCYECMYNGRGCASHIDHDDYKITEVQIT